MSKRTNYSELKLFWVVIFFSIFAKLIEWSIQYFVYDYSVGIQIALFQIFFISGISTILFLIFHYLIKPKNQHWYLTIPALAYFLKEVYNLYLSNFNFSMPMINALTFEPMVILLITYLVDIFTFQIRE